MSSPVSNPSTLNIPAGTTTFTISGLSMAQYVQQVTASITLNGTIVDTVTFVSEGYTQNASVPMTYTAIGGDSGTIYQIMTNGSGGSISFSFDYNNGSGAWTPSSNVYQLPDVSYGMVDPGTGKTAGLTLCGFNTDDNGSSDSWNMNSQIFVAFL